MFLYRKELWAFYRPYLRRLVADLFCALVASVFALLIPLLVRYFTETLLDSGFFFWQLALAGGVILLCIALQAACTYYMDAKGHELGARMERDVRQSLFAHCQRLSFSFYDERRAAEIMSRLTSDSLLLTEFFHHFPEDLVVNGVKFIGAAVILVGLNWQLAALIFCLLPFMLAYTLHFNKKMRRAYRQIYRKIADVNAQAEDSLQGIRTVQSFANEGLEEEKFSRENQSFFENRSEGYRSEAVLDTGAKAFAQIILLCVLLYGGVLLARGALSLPDLLVFLLYISYFTSPIEQLVHMTQQYQEGVTGFSRYLEIMRETPQVSDLPGAREAGELRGDIQFCNVAFRYGQGPDILKGVDFSIRAGEYVALVGASGVGKTTLCQLIARFYDVQQGAVLLDGVDVRAMKLSSLRRQIGIVQQEMYLFSGTIAENIAYGKPGASREEIEQAAKEAGAHEFICALSQGYDTDVGPRGARLSGGQKQRICIARVFLKNPPILILDEATSALDSESEQVVQRSLGQLAKNRTTIVIAHRLSTVRQAERILVLAEGDICEEGAHQELMRKNGVYARLYQAWQESAG